MQQKWLLCANLMHKQGLAYCICFLITGAASFNEVRADMFCMIKTQRAECTPLPVITRAKFSLTDSHFNLSAEYASCFSERTLEIQGRVLQTVNTENVQEFELLGENFEPVTDFIAFPRTIAYLVLDKSTKKGTFTDVWSAHRLRRYPASSELTVPVNCEHN